MLMVLKPIVLRAGASFALTFILIMSSLFIIFSVMLHEYIGQIYPLSYPNVFRFGFVDFILVISTVFGVLSGICGAFIPSVYPRYVIMAGFYLMAVGVASYGMADYVSIFGGATWGFGEAFYYYIWHPILYPSVNLCGLVVLYLMAELCKYQTTSHHNISRKI